MAKYTDNINGYIEAENDLFVFHITDQLVSMLPAERDPIGQNEAIKRLRNNYHKLPHYLLGTDEQYFKVAIFRNLDMEVRSSLSGYPSFCFYAPLIIRSGGNASEYYRNLPETWNKYHAISFYGGNINAIYNPAVSIIQPTWEEVASSSGIRDIKFRSYEEYTKSINCEIDGEKFEFSITVTQKGDRNDPEKMGAYNLGERNACIRLVFEKPQDFDTFPKYFNIIQKLVAILTRQNNVTFNAYLCQKRPDDKLLYPTAVCYTFERYEDFSKRRPDKVIPIEIILPYIPEIINRITSDFYAPLFVLLPDSNKDAKRISITNIQDLCTALEVVYGFRKEKREKDQTIEALKKEIKKTIKVFLSEHDNNFDINRQTNISSSFQYLSITSKEKILTLYNEYKEIIDHITDKWRLHNLTYEDIVAFVDLRNNKTHSGIIEMGNAANYYVPLFALVYTSYFKETGISEELISNLLDNLF